MLYSMAKIYDEWDGEDYEGSSCRGTMKGWHRHGVCKEISWKCSTDEEKFPKENWSQEAVQNPLGAYYRINKDSVTDMQAAIKEVGAIYCSAVIHSGWYIKNQESLLTIECSQESIGGHAFAIVGYNADGFIVQNSWGEEWGHQGFAVITYKDWVKNGADAWVAVRGAPMTQRSSPHTFSNHSLGSVSDDFEKEIIALKKGIKNRDIKDIRPWNEEEAYNHSLVIGNNGRPKLTMVGAQTPEISVQIICHDKIEKWIKESPDNRKIVIYAHGGMISEESSINKIRVMAPYFKANGIYPLFVTWKTSVLETITNQIEDKIIDIFSRVGIEPSSTQAKGILKKSQEAIDRAIENFARKIVVKGSWSEIKENAQFASDRAVRGYARHGHTKAGGMVLLSKELKRLKDKFDCEIHLVGHSAGSILFGYWMDELIKRELSVHSITFFAPACTMEFANKHYIKAYEKKIFAKEKMFIHILDDERECACQGHYILKTMI
jgi:predicted alpha/beta hydrolase family esterase